MHGVTEVGGGQVRGIERGGVWTFSGIPFAASPAGHRRWRPPVAPEPWSGVRTCDRFGPVAPQNQMLAAIFPGATPEPSSEDCLSLNVWTPGLDGAKRPVMLWIHGGSFLSGSGSTGLYRGTDLARDGDVVVVTVNYRLGLLGYLAHPTLGEQGQTWLGGDEWAGSGNWGLADQVAALRWVHDHIAGFGGDPGCVTLFGESAGGMSVSALLGTPAASGLFHRAVVQSGPPYTMSADTAADVAEKLASQMGVACTREALEQVPADRLVAAAAEFAGTGDSSVDGLPLRPVVDGGLLSRPPLSSVVAGSVAEIPLLIGTTRDEWTLFTLSDPANSSLDADRLRWRLVRAFGDEGAADRVTAAVRSARACAGRASGGPRPLDGDRHRVRVPCTVGASGRRTRRGGGTGRGHLRLPLHLGVPDLRRLARLLPRAGRALRVRHGAVSPDPRVHRRRRGCARAVSCHASGVGLLRPYRGPRLRPVRGRPDVVAAMGRRSPTDRGARSADGRCRPGPPRRASRDEELEAVTSVLGPVPGHRTR